MSAPRIAILAAAAACGALAALAVAPAASAGPGCPSTPGVCAPQPAPCPGEKPGFCAGDPRETVVQAPIVIQAPAPKVVTSDDGYSLPAVTG